LGNVLIAEPSNNYRNNHKKSEPRFFQTKLKVFTLTKGQVNIWTVN